MLEKKKKHRFTQYYLVSHEMKGYSKDGGRSRTTVFLTHGTTEEGLDFVSVLQPVPHTGKHFQSGYLTASAATWGGGGRHKDGCKEREKGVREEKGRKGRKRQGREGRKEGRKAGRRE